MTEQKKEAGEFASGKSSGSLASNLNHTLNTQVGKYDPKTTYALYVEYLFQEKYALKTINNRKSLLGIFLNSLEVNDVRKITVTEVDSYLRKRVDSHTENSLNTDRRIIRSFFLFCEEHLNIFIPFNYRRILREIEPGEVIRNTISLERMRALVSRMDNEQDKLMASLLYESAIRLEELATLRAENINGHCIKIRGKGRRVRTSFVTKELAEVIHNYMIENSIFKGSLFRHSEKQCSKHCSIKSGPFHTDTIRRRLTRQLKNQGVRDITPHGLRRSFATDFYNRSKDIKATQKILGHKRVETTEIYVQIPDQYAERAYLEFVPTTVYS